MTRDEWLEEFVAAIDIAPPGREEVKAILELAATAAHASERTAAPVACWLAGVSGRPLGELCEIAETIEAAQP